MTAADLNELKRVAAERAVAEVTEGMVLGLGTGSTAALAVAALGRRVSEGLTIRGVPTSEATAAQARSLNIPLTDLGADPRLDLTIDGADAVDLDDFSLIKGLGGALLREKIVAAAAGRMIVIVDETKLGGALGSRTPIPVEVVPFGWTATERHLQALGARTKLRLARAGGIFVTDGGNYIVDCDFGAIAKAPELAAELKRITGVVETGLFIGLATDIVIARPNGVEMISTPRNA